MRLPYADVLRWSKHWNFESKEALKTATFLYKDNRFSHSLFFCQLAVEKKIKSVFVIHKQVFPPPVHDLLYLAKKLQAPLKREILEDLAEINSFNISARYDDYKQQFYKKATRDYCAKWLAKSKKILIIFENI